MPETNEPERLIAALLRQLSVGLSAYRLYPGDLLQPGFAGAARRIEAAAQEALSTGTVRIQVTGDGFAGEDGEIGPGEGAERLARACYERRVERLRIESPPGPDDLAALYDVLTRAPEELFAMGGADAVLRASGVSSIGVREVDPMAVPESAVGEPNLPGDEPHEAFDLSSLREALGLPEEDAALLSGSPADLAESLFSRFQAVVASLPPETAASLDLYRALHDIVEGLPAEQRVMLDSVLLERSLEDPLAERYVGTMSDTELARMIVDVARRLGHDPAETAGRLAARRLRSGDLIELTVAVATGRTEGGTVLAGLERAGIAIYGAAPDPERPAAGEGGGDRLVYETVSDLLGRSLLAHEEEDMEVLRSNFPQDEDEQLEAAAAAVRDYLHTEADVDRLQRVLGAWTATARRALRDGDVEGVGRAAAVLEGDPADPQGGPDRAALFRAHRGRVAQGDVLREVVERARREGSQEQAALLLGPLGKAAVVGLLDLLADASDGGGRSVISGLATRLAPEHLDVVAERVGDRRTAVARDALAVAHRAGGQRALPLLERASRHPAPEVREEAVHGFVAVGGAGAVDRLAALALDPDAHVGSLAVAGLGGLVAPDAARALARVAASAGSTTVRQEAIDQLGRHPSADSGALLAGLASRAGGRRMPRRLRRRARQLARGRRR